MAGVRKNDPMTIVAINGRPNSRKGCFASAFRYLEGRVDSYELGLNRLAGNTAMFDLKCLDTLFVQDAQMM